MLQSMAVENGRACKRRDEEEYSDGNPPNGKWPVASIAA
jgi:hypothetical protein